MQSAVLAIRVQRRTALTVGPSGVGPGKPGVRFTALIPLVGATAGGMVGVGAPALGPGAVGSTPPVTVPTWMGDRVGSAPGTSVAGTNVAVVIPPARAAPRRTIPVRMPIEIS